MVSQIVGKKIIDSLVGIMEAGTLLLKEKGYEAVGFKDEETAASTKSIGIAPASSARLDQRLPDESAQSKQAQMQSKEAKANKVEGPSY